MIDTIKLVPRVTSETGLYEVDRSDASITYTTNTTEINNLKQTELRYAGESPNNYVLFNEETWRVIGLVNVPEGQRVKIIRNESIGDFSWDSSESNINSGYGVNEWSGADLMTLLNSGAYYNRTSGTCYNDRNNATTSCNFDSTGLTPTAKNMIDTVTWNFGANPTANNYSITPKEWYNVERGNTNGKKCPSITTCNDTISRNLTWKGQVGLMYPSDYGYATSDRTCLTKVINSVTTWTSSCFDNDWLYKSGVSQWLNTPHAASGHATAAFQIINTGSLERAGVNTPLGVMPTLYLKASVKVSSGSGTSSSPWVLIA